MGETLKFQHQIGRVGVVSGDTPILMQITGKYYFSIGQNFSGQLRPICKSFIQLKTTYKKHFRSSKPESVTQNGRRPPLGVLEREIPTFSHLLDTGPSLCVLYSEAGKTTRGNLRQQGKSILTLNLESEDQPGQRKTQSDSQHKGGNKTQVCFIWPTSIVAHSCYGQCQ